MCKIARSTKKQIARERLNEILATHHQTPKTIPPNREKHNQPLTARFIDPAPLPEDAEPIDKMRHKLNSVDGRKVYAQRKSTVEPVFGIIKHVLGFR